jgi:CRISPR-associated protein Cas2
MELLTYVIYDIENDRIRKRVAEDCKDAGLERVQFSVFQGPLDRTRRKELMSKLIERLGDGRGRFLMLGMCERDAREVREHSVDYDEFPPAARQGQAA